MARVFVKLETPQRGPGKIQGVDKTHEHDGKKNVEFGWIWWNKETSGGMQQTKEGSEKKSDVGNSVVVMLFSELFSLVFRIMVAAYWRLILHLKWWFGGSTISTLEWRAMSFWLQGPNFFIVLRDGLRSCETVQRIARLQNGPWRVPGIVVGLRVNSQLFMIKTFMWLCLSVWCALLRRCILHYLWCTLVMCDSISSVCCSCIPQWHRSARVLRIAVQQARRKKEGNVA